MAALGQQESLTLRSWNFRSYPGVAFVAFCLAVSASMTACWNDGMRHPTRFGHWLGEKPISAVFALQTNTKSHYGALVGYGRRLFPVHLTRLRLACCGSGLH
jgi:hypothetical protein